MVLHAIRQVFYRDRNEVLQSFGDRDNAPIARVTGPTIDIRIELLPYPRIADLGVMTKLIVNSLLIQVREMRTILAAGKGFIK